METGRADYQALLVYDVSQLGPFQDTDEAATYELRLRSAGIRVGYVSEQFRNDGSIGSSTIKTVKRAMAGEYSREPWRSQKRADCGVPRRDVPTADVA